MSQDVEIKGFGLARIKEEGAPVHPDEIDVPMHMYKTERYQRWYDRQLEAYNNYHKAKDEASSNS